MSEVTERLEDADLGQQAIVLWWPDDEVATRQGEFKQTKAAGSQHWRPDFFLCWTA
jgi:hypothetical protein